MRPAVANRRSAQKRALSRRGAPAPRDLEARLPLALPNLSLDGRVALITGAGSGIGAATAALFSQAGARLALVDRSRPGLKQTAENLPNPATEFQSFPGDTASSEFQKASAHALQQTWRRLDVIVANAGINGVWAPLDEIAPEEWEQTLRINLTGTFLTLRYFLPLMRKSGGSVIIVSSINGTRVFSKSGATAYACSKAGLVALGKMAALEVAKYRIRINVICPGSVDTAIDQSLKRRHLDSIQTRPPRPFGEVPLTAGKAASPRRVAELALFLASDLSCHISGTEVFIDGAQSLLGP